MVGKAKSFARDTDDSVYQKQFDNELYSTTHQNSYNLGSTHFSDQSGIGNFSQAGGDQRKANLKGALFRGNIGFNLQTVLLDVGTSTIDLNNDSAGTALAEISQDRLVFLSAGTTSDLTTITGAQRPGQRVALYNLFSNTITIKNNGAAVVNTIVTPGAVDFVLSGHGLVTLVFDISLTQWRIEGNIGSGGTSTSQFLDGLFRIKNTADETKRLKFDLSSATTSTTITLKSNHTANRTVTFPDLTTTLAGLSVDQSWTGDNTFTGTIFNVQTNIINLGDSITDTINFLGRVGDLGIIPINNSMANLGASGKQWNNLWIDTLNNATTVAIVSPNFAINSAQITLGDAITDEINFLGRANSDLIPISDATVDLGATTKAFAEIWVDTLRNDATISVSTTNFSINSTNINLGDATSDTINFLGRVGTDIDPDGDGTLDLGSSALEWNQIFVQIINGTSTVAVVSPNFAINSAQITLGDATSDDISFLGQIDTKMVIEEITIPSTPPANTLVLYGKLSSSVTKLFYRQEDGTEVGPLGTGGGGGDVFLANTQTFTGVNTFTGTTFNVQTSAINLGDSTSDDINFLGRVGTDIDPDGDATRDLGSSALEWSQIFVQSINATASTAVSSPTFSINSSTINLGDAVSDNINVLGKLNTDVRLDGGKRIRSDSSTEIGYYVTNATSTIGTAGTNQIPVVVSITPSVANFDAAFGSEIGCMGMYNTTTATPVLAIKNLAAEWVLLAIPDAGGNVLGDHIN